MKGLTKIIIEFFLSKMRESEKDDKITNIKNEVIEVLPGKKTLHQKEKVSTNSSELGN